MQVRVDRRNNTHVPAIERDSLSAAQSTSTRAESELSVPTTSTKSTGALANTNEMQRSKTTEHMEIIFSFTVDC